MDPNFLAGDPFLELDYCMVSCITQRPTMNNAKDHPKKLVDAAYKRKIDKYYPCKIQPIAMTWPGCMDNKTEDFLNKLCSYIKQLDSLPFYNIKQFILKRLSFVLLRSFANCIIYSHRNHYNKFSDPIRNQDFSAENIIESTNTNQIYNNNNHLITTHIDANKTVNLCTTSYQYTSRVQLNNRIALVH